MASDPLLVPVQLEAFVLNPAVCGEPDDGNARICPITQPNYTFLRFRDFVAQSDVQGHADLHNTAPSSLNSRMTDLGTYPGTPRRNRHGVYLHWTLPRAYRSGISSTETVPKGRRDNERLRHGLPIRDEDPKDPESTTPEYIEPPTRWMVIRRLNLDTIEPQSARSKFSEYDAWVIESDYLWNLDDIPANYDLQVDVSPFIVGGSGGDVDIKAQAEVFIGRKTRLQEWENKPQPNRPNISLLHSSNQLFADFQLHNSNVFSMVDNFQYSDASKPQYLDTAQADYYLVGWHWKDNADPLWMPGDERSHSERIESLFMELKDNEEWKNAVDKVRLVCHGAMYNVEWNHRTKPKVVPADHLSKRLLNQKLPTLSIGTTPLDALITYCTARKRKGNNKEKDETAKLEEHILAIQSLLHARDDGVEGQREAKDTVYNWNFMRSPGGTQYFLADENSKESDGRPIQPDEKSQEALKALNQQQSLLDSSQRACQQLQWQMFSAWWKYFADPSNQEDEARRREEEFKKITNDLSTKIVQAEKQMERLRKDIEVKLKDEHPENRLKSVKAGTQPFFYRARDPTLLIGGIDQGWPSDYLDNAKARLKGQVIASSVDLPAGLSELDSLMKNKFKTAMRPEMLAAVEALINEFYALTPENGTAGNPPEGKEYPQFHDSLDGFPRDQWTQRQPFRPLYMEWEIEYTHIPFEHWSLGEQTARLSDNKQVRYGIKPDKTTPLWEKLGSSDRHDTRILSGRVLVLPQPSFSLDSKIQQLFSDTSPTTLDKYLKEKDRDALSRNVRKLPYLSAPLSGLSDGLLTLAQGTHIKPLNKEIKANGEKFSAIKEAILEQVGFTKKNLEMIAGNSALTPYANMVAFNSETHCPFKPASHGQFRFRKMNIIDKFGQTLVGNDPQPQKKGPPPLYPCISDFFEPQMFDDTNFANTVIKNKEGLNEFIQVPPQINQNSRLNATFVKRNKEGSSYWRPTTEWENPIWGWVVTNYADYGLQFFLPDGTFYREVRFGGPNGVLEEPKWIPFKPNVSTKASNTPDRAQFDALIDRLIDPEYLKGFWYMIVKALGSLPPTPSSYAQYLTAIVGKPLALVNMGWSLELDQPPLKNESTKSKVNNPPISLVKPENSENTSMYYQLQVKLGDKEREYDGLVGYFDVADPQKQTEGKELNLDTVHTYFVPSAGHKPLEEINTQNYPIFTAFYEPALPSGEDDSVDPALYDDGRNRQLQVYGAIVDPFTAVHAYSSFLPAQALQLAPWTWQEAMNRMTAFFHAGPVTVTKDVSEYSRDRQLTTENMQDEPAEKVALPALDAGEWNWLQAYVDPDAGEDLAKPPVFNAYAIDNMVNWKKPGFQDGPYTAIEGFLQLRRPIMKEKPS